MFVSVERLLVRIRQVPSRAEELVALRRRLRTEGAVQADADERATALAIRAIKLELASATGVVSACSSCATGKPWPRGAHDGGDCCSGSTADVFDDHEVALLAQAGTRPRDLIAPRGEHPGCAFRGARGCTLPIAHRPGLCVHYACTTLRRELHARGRLDHVEALIDELDRRLTRFIALREARLARADFEAV